MKHSTVCISIIVLSLLLVSSTAVGVEMTINPNQFDTLISEAKTGFEAADKTANKALKAVDSSIHFVTDSLIGTVENTLKEVRNFTDQMCQTAHLIQRSISDTAGQINGDLIIHTRGLLDETLLTVNELSSKLERVANVTVTRTVDVLEDVIRGRAVDIGKVVIGSCFFFGLVSIIARLIPKNPEKATFTDYTKSLYPLSCLTVAVSAMIAITDRIAKFTEDTPPTFQPLILHLVMLSDIVAVTNIYFYMVMVVALNWDHEKLHYLVAKTVKPTGSINAQEEEESILLNEKSYEKKREHTWQLAAVWIARGLMIIGFSILLILALTTIGYLIKLRVAEVKSRPDFHEYD